MNETLLKLCCQEFDTYYEALRANPYDPTHYKIQYWLSDHSGMGQTSCPKTSGLTVLQLDSGKFAWVPDAEQDARLVIAVKQMLKEEAEKAIASVSNSPNRKALSGELLDSLNAATEWHNSKQEVLSELDARARLLLQRAIEVRLNPESLVNISHLLESIAKEMSETKQTYSSMVEEFSQKFGVNNG